MFLSDNRLRIWALKGIGTLPLTKSQSNFISSAAALPKHAEVQTFILHVDAPTEPAPTVLFPTHAEVLKSPQAPWSLLPSKHAEG
jgi:hypothetical protein